MRPGDVMCKNCEYYGDGIVCSRKYGEREAKKCFINSDTGVATYNLDRCPKESPKCRRKKELVEVVRCRNCKHWNEWESGTGSCRRSKNGYNWFGIDATDYCSFGERKDA